MEKWSDTIPFSADDLRLIEADRLARKIEECYWDYNVSIKIRKKGYNPCCGDGFKFEVKLNSGTRIESVEKLISTVQYKLKIPVLKAVREKEGFYLATYTSHTLSLDNDLSRILKSEEYRSAFTTMKIAHPVGVDPNGNAVICDLVEYPHVMINGTTRSGKSTALKCLLVSLARYSNLKVNLLIADRGAGLSMFADLPHLSYPIIHTPNKLATVIMLLKDEMERRTDLELSDQDHFKKLPYIVCIIDEFAWFIEEIGNRKKSEKVIKIINDILRYGRHNKIHLVLSIYDPKQEIAKIELGDIRVKMVFQTVNSRKSSNALGSGGAEKLNGSGEMIFDHINSSYQLQGVFIDDDKIGSGMLDTRAAFSVDFETGELLNYGFTISDEDLKRKEAETEEYIINFSPGEDNSGSKDEQEGKFVDVVLWVLSQKSISINSIQEEHPVGNKYAKI
ncbi:MAG: hypothetical protein K2G55_09045 [Lachnospiraceae bacterium]|nr:hypothetical protein [Lachnospiraceae bacterium]MDE7202625.1 hypothetical protein [Lachnospiraceae bacterium]